jgi:hypothetical protein
MRSSACCNVVATRTNGARRLRRFRLEQTCDVAEFPEPRKVQTVKRPDRRRAEAALWRAAKAEGRAPAPLVVEALNTYKTPGYSRYVPPGQRNVATTFSAEQATRLVEISAAEDSRCST